jgi:hypothetical protein
VANRRDDRPNVGPRRKVCEFLGRDVPAESLSQPTWTDGTKILTKSDGLGTFGDDTLFGSFVALVSPGIGGSYTFWSTAPPAARLRRRARPWRVKRGELSRSVALS